MFETTWVSLAAQQPKISKTLLCWYIDTCLYWQVFLEENNVSLDPILFLLCATSSLDGRPVGLAPFWTLGSGNSWPRQGGEKHCYLNAAGRKSWQRNRKCGTSTAVIDWKFLLCPVQVHWKKKLKEKYRLESLLFVIVMLQNVTLHWTFKTFQCQISPKSDPSKRSLYGHESFDLCKLLIFQGMWACYCWLL